MSVVTKTGDQGYTGRYGSGKTSKDDISVVAGGDIDELNSAIGLLLAREDIPDSVSRSLYGIQKLCFVIGSEIAASQGGHPEEGYKITRLAETDLSWIEERISELENSIAPQRNFILPGGCPASAMCHWVRSVCRRAERSAVSISKIYDLSALSLKILNRASDYFYVLARFLNNKEGIGEQIWKGERN